MKRTLFLTMALLGSAMAQSAETTPSYTLGDVMYVGDSITHGVGAASYRWAMHKILVDNGITYDEVGVKEANYSGGVAPGTEYGNVAFENVHSAHSGAMSYGIAGLKSDAKFDYSTILNWFGQSTTKNNGATYTGPVISGDDVPETFFLLAGTNDMLTVYSRGTLGGFGADPEYLKTELKSILGYNSDNKEFQGGGSFDIIVGSMREANADAEIIVSSIPCWMDNRTNSNNAEDFAAVTAYNEVLEQWCAENNVKYVNVNKGMYDVARTDKPGVGVQNMFGGDKLHPSAQGDLIIAGNLAKAMGYAGRTAGQQRVAAGEGEGWTTLTASNAASTESVSLNNVTTTGSKLDFSAEGTSSVSIAWENVGKLNNGFTLELSDWCVGNGYTDGIWNTTDNLSIVLGNDFFYGTLNINEAYIQWGSEILYSYDMSTLGTTDNLRIAYLSGSASEGVNQGFYVWLGDMLIGEGKGRTEGSGHNGVTLTYSGTGNVTIGSVSVNAEASYAPTTSGITNASDAFIAKIVPPAPPAEPQGNITIPAGSITHSVTSSANVVNAMNNITSEAGKVYSITVEMSDGSHAIGNMTTRSGDIYATFTKGSFNNYAAAQGGSTGKKLTGDITLIFSEDYKGGTTVIGAHSPDATDVNVTGDVTLVFDAASATFTTTFTTVASQKASVIGAYGANITGTFKAVINNGTFKNDIFGGIHSANTDGNNTIGRTQIYVNGGSLAGNVYGGGQAGTIGSTQARSNEPATLVTVTNGVIDGNVYGGGQADTINGDTQVNITGGTIKGNVYGGGTGGTINGNTYVTIDGNLAAFKGTTISAGGTGGTINGNSTLTIKNAASSDYEGSIDKYKGTLSGGANVTGTRTLAFDKAKLSGTSFDLATLENFDIITLSGGSNVSLSSLGGATELSLTSSTLRVTGDSSKLWSITMDIDSALTLTNLDGTEAQNIFINVTGSNVDLSQLNLTITESELAHQAVLEYVYLRANGKIYEVAVDWRDQQGAVRNLVAGKLIPEPATATLSLLALAALAARRRRR